MHQNVLLFTSGILKYRDVSMMSIILNSIASLNIISIDYSCIISRISKRDPKMKI